MKLTHFLGAVLLRTGNALTRLSNRILFKHVNIIERRGNWVICRTDNIIWQLDITRYVDRKIFECGVFEPESTQWLNELIKPGMVVVDVGANFGYYTIHLSRLVNDTGRV